MTVARILVKLDLKKGLPQEFTINSATGTIVQMLDYEGIPFRCHRCHVYGHGVESCPLPFKGMVRKAKGSSTSLSPLGKNLKTVQDTKDYKGQGHQSGEGVTTKVPRLKQRTSLHMGALLFVDVAFVSSPTTRAPTQQGHTTLGISPLEVTSCTSFPFSSLNSHDLEANKGVP